MDCCGFRTPRDGDGHGLATFADRQVEGTSVGLTPERHSCKGRAMMKKKEHKTRTVPVKLFALVIKKSNEFIKCIHFRFENIMI
jgi:hypothetical protein